jgi:hypothetical protein
MVKGKRIRVPQWIEGRTSTGPFVVRVEAEAVIPDADTTEPCFEPATVRWLEELQRMADAGNVDELSRHGTVYVRRSA